MFQILIFIVNILGVVTDQSVCWTRLQGIDSELRTVVGGGGGGGERLFEKGDYFKHFRQRGAIIRGRRLIERRLLFEEIR